jgi:hypothetical protein
MVPITKVVVQFTSGRSRTLEVIDVSIGVNTFVLKRRDGVILGWNLAAIESWEVTPPPPELQDTGS